ncbi:MAG: hypothetical protein K9N49_00285 [Candidatus Marinimicrobia bacterium]|nr:hypothetical protein [Candidatus Neomarinimicrobiota bacterium]
MMKTKSVWRGGWRVSMLVLAGLAAAGCDESGRTTYYSETEVVEEVVVDAPGEAVQAYALDVLVLDPWGEPHPAAAVEVHVTTYPQQRFASRTAPDGAARFSFQAPPGTAVLAYARDDQGAQGLIETYTDALPGLITLRLPIGY